MMHAHFSVHWDHRDDGRLSRAARELGSAYSWLAGPAWSAQERQRRELSEVAGRNRLTDAF